MIQEGVHAVFQVPIAYYENKKLIEKLKKYILSKNARGIESEVAFGLKTNLVESKFNLFNEKEDILKELAQWIGFCLKKTINNIQMENIDYRINFRESWYHITKTNGIHEPHIHPNCSWCGIYYVQSGDNQSGHTVFETPIKSTFIDSGNLFANNMNIARIKPEDGMLVLFPSYLSHYQALYTGKEERIVVAFNASVNK
tara:strand:+ start:172 stop:768 length:597 start_codon:yes stop_codon:yes gene_type:complete